MDNELEGIWKETVVAYFKVFPSCIVFRHVE